MRSVDLDGPVCRDEFEPGFTSSELAQFLHVQLLQFPAICCLEAWVRQ